MNLALQISIFEFGTRALDWSRRENPCYMIKIQELDLFFFSLFLAFCLKNISSLLILLVQILFRQQVTLFFKYSRSYCGVGQLVILDERQPLDKGTIWMVHSPLPGKYANQWQKLTNLTPMHEWSREVSLSRNSKVSALQSSHHQHSWTSSWLTALGYNIIEGKFKWGDNFNFTGEFYYTKEWRKCLEVYPRIQAHQKMEEMPSDLSAYSIKPNNGGDANEIYRRIPTH